MNRSYIKLSLPHVKEHDEFLLVHSDRVRMPYSVLLKELEEFKVAKVCKLNMYPMVFFLVLFEIKPVLFHLLQTCLSLR
jgi:hypothetical protein